jgi:hypothetical protein
MDASSASLPLAPSATLPAFELLRLTPLGAVVRAGERMNLGTSFACGIQLPLSSHRSRKVDLGAVVVDCRACETDGKGLPWEVTLLFDEPTASQSRLLRHAVATTSSAGGPAPWPSDLGSGEFHGFGLN